MASITPSQFTPLESFSLTAKCTRKMMEWNHSTTYPRLLPIIAKIVGCVAVFFALLADMIIHATLTLAKALVVLPVQPFKLCFSREIPRDLDISSLFAHLMFSIDKGAKVFTLPVITFFDPDRAYRASQSNGFAIIEIHRFIKKERSLEEEVKKLQYSQKEQEQILKKSETLEKEKNVLADQIKVLELELAAFKKATDEKKEVLKQNVVEPKNKDNHAESKPEKAKVVKNLMAEFNEAKLNKDLVSLERAHSFAGTPSSKGMGGYASPPRRYSGSPFKFYPADCEGNELILDQKAVDARQQLLKTLTDKSNKNRLKPVEQKNNEFENEKMKIDGMLDGPGFQIYCKFVEKLTEYFNAYRAYLQSGENDEICVKPEKIDCDELRQYGEIARKEIRNATTLEMIEQRLKLYQDLLAYVTPRRTELKQRRNENQQQDKIDVEDKTRLDAEFLALAKKEKEETKKELLKSLEFLNVEWEAARPENIQKTNTIINEFAQENQEKIHDFTTLLLKIKQLKQQILTLSSFSKNNETEEFLQIVKLVKAINEAYIFGLNKPLDKGPYNQKLALTALSFIKVEQEVSKNFYATHVNEIINKGSNGTINDIKRFKIEIEAMVKEIKADKPVDAIKLSHYQWIIGELNKGGYFPKLVAPHYLQNK